MKLAIRLLTLMCAAAVVAVPMTSAVEATTTDSKTAKKHVKKPQRVPSVSSRARPSDNPFPPFDEDPDRKASGGGY